MSPYMVGLYYACAASGGGIMTYQQYGQKVNYSTSYWVKIVKEICR